MSLHAYATWRMLPVFSSGSSTQSATSGSAAVRAPEVMAHTTHSKIARQWRSGPAKHSDNLKEEEAYARYSSRRDLHCRRRTLDGVLARRPGIHRTVQPHLHRGLARTLRRKNRSAAVGIPWRSADTRHRHR